MSTENKPQAKPDPDPAKAPYGNEAELPMAAHQPADPAAPAVDLLAALLEADIVWVQAGQTRPGLRNAWLQRISEAYGAHSEQSDLHRLRELEARVVHAFDPHV